MIRAMTGKVPHRDSLSACFFFFFFLFWKMNILAESPHVIAVWATNDTNYGAASDNVWC